MSSDPSFGQSLGYSTASAGAFIRDSLCSTIATAGPSLSCFCGCPSWVFIDACFRAEGLLSKFLLTLYVTGTSPRTQTAIDNLNRICSEELEGRYELQIIDVLEHPQRAEDERILATPTLIKELPPPLRRVIGDLSDKEKVLLGLEVRPPRNQPSAGSDAS